MGGHSRFRQVKLGEVNCLVIILKYLDGIVYIFNNDVATAHESVTPRL